MAPMHNQLIEDFKQAYADMVRMDLAGLDQLYDPKIVFRDPVHRISGIAALQDYFAGIMANVQECRFEFLDQLSSADTAYLKWNMHLRHPRLDGGERLTVRGMSQLQFNQRIVYHEDSYDMGEMLYEHLPMVGGLTRWLKGRLAG